MSSKLTLAIRPGMLSMQGDAYIQPTPSRFQSTVGAILRFFFIVLSAMLILGLAVA
jgi:hypothetical protein